jgi:hypothetical protein
VAVPFGQGFERAEISPKPDQDALQAVMLFSARTPPPGAAGNANKPCWWRSLILALRGCPGPGMTLSFRDCEINLERRELWRAKRAIHVEPQVFDLLV